MDPRSTISGRKIDATFNPGIHSLQQWAESLDPHNITHIQAGEKIELGPQLFSLDHRTGIVSQLVSVSVSQLVSQSVGLLAS